MSGPSIDRLDELQAFAETVQAGSLSRAARRLRVPVNQVSRRLSRLEERLGVTLIARTTRRLEVTVEGARLLPRAAEILRLARAAEREVADQSAPSGVLRIALPTLLAEGRLLGEVMGALSAHPDLRVELSVRDAPLDPVRHGYDVAVVAGRPEDSSATMTRLGKTSPVLGAHPDYLARAGTPKRPADLVRHECLLFMTDSPQRVWPLVGADGRTRKVRVGGRFASDSSRLLQEALHAGAGIGIMMEEDSFAPPGKHLVRVLPKFRHAPFVVYALTQPGQRDTPRCRLALSLLQRGVSLAA